ncbi:MAG: hypothetical protein ABJC26_04965 [Gemmatimonadaceae bacterium]
MIINPLFVLIRAWLVTALCDGLFSSALAALFYGSTVTKLWQGVASSILGKDAMDGGTTPALIGVLMHVGVALAWTTLFFLMTMQSAWLRKTIGTTSGMLAVACVYGPIIWMTMSLVLFPQLYHRPTTINFRWWIQFFGHMVFVALPIVAMIRKGISQSVNAN